MAASREYYMEQLGRITDATEEEMATQKGIRQDSPSNDDYYCRTGEMANEIYTRLYTAHYESINFKLRRIALNLFHL